MALVGRVAKLETEDTVRLARRIDAADFTSFDRPGRARIGSTEGLLRYWRLLSPFIGSVMRAQLRTIAPAVR